MHLLRLLGCVVFMSLFAATAKAAALVVPTPDQIPRVKPGQTPSLEARRMSCWVQDTRAHAPLGKAYVVLTDVQDQESTKAVKKLLDHHKGKLLKLGRNELKKNNVLILEFNKYGLLGKKEFYNKDQMNKISFAKDITENEIRKENFIYSFLSSVRQKMQTRRK